MSDDFMRMVQSQLTNPQLISQLSQHIGVSDHQKTAAATSGIAAILAGALAHNASRPRGANALANALDRDHDGSILDDVIGMVSGGAQHHNSRTLNGAGILGHILGNKVDSAANNVSRMSGLNKNQVTNLMIKLAPVILGLIGKFKRNNNVGASGLGGLLGGLLGGGQHGRGGGAMDIISGFLDKDGDGDISREISQIGSSILGGLFKRH